MKLLFSKFKQVFKKLIDQAFPKCGAGAIISMILTILDSSVSEGIGYGLDV
jgi:hypothetical protein